MEWLLENTERKKVNLEFYIQWKYLSQIKEKWRLKKTQLDAPEFITCIPALQEMLNSLGREYMKVERNLVLHKEMKNVRNGKKCGQIWKSFIFNFFKE